MNIFDRPYFVLLIFSFLGFFANLDNGFMLDDYIVLFNEGGIFNKNFLQLFTEYQNLVYRPIGHAPLWILYKFFGTHAILYHIANLFLFVTVSFLFFKITEMLFANRNLAWLTAILYTLHPINNILVNYVTANILSVFVISLQVSFIYAIYYLDQNKKWLLFISLFCFLLSLFSHEMSMFYPAFVFCFVYFLKEFDFKKSIVFTLPYIGVAAIYFGFRMIFFSLKGSASAVLSVAHIFDAYISSVMALIYWYLGKMVYPKDIVFLWTAVIEEHLHPLEVYRLFGILIIVGILIFVRWKKGLKPFALSVFLIGLAPAFWASYAHFPFTEPMIEPHWFYFSSFGFYLLIAYGIIWLKEKINHVVWKMSLGGVLIYLFVLLQQGNLHWKNQESYCRFWISDNGYNATPFYGMGQVSLGTGNYHDAINYFEKMYTISNGYQRAYITADVGYAYLQVGDYNSAKKYLMSAAEVEPNYSVTYYYLGLMAWRQGDLKAAEELYSKAISFYPRSTFYHSELALIRSGQSPTGTYPLFNLQ